MIFEKDNTPDLSFGESVSWLTDILFNENKFPVEEAEVHYKKACAMQRRHDRCSAEKVLNDLKVDHKTTYTFENKPMKALDHIIKEEGAWLVTISWNGGRSTRTLGVWIQGVELGCIDACKGIYRLQAENYLKCLLYKAIMNAWEDQKGPKKVKLTQSDP